MVPIIALIICIPSLILVLALCSAAGRADDAIERHARETGFDFDWPAR